MYAATRGLLAPRVHMPWSTRVCSSNSLEASVNSTVHSQMLRCTGTGSRRGPCLVYLQTGLMQTGPRLKFKSELVCRQTPQSLYAYIVMVSWPTISLKVMKLGVLSLSGDWKTSAFVPGLMPVISRARGSPISKTLQPLKTVQVCWRYCRRIQQQWVKVQRYQSDSWLMVDPSERVTCFIGLVILYSRGWIACRIKNSIMHSVTRHILRLCSFVRGVPLLPPIQDSTALVFRKAVEAHPSRAMVHSYQQRTSLTYSQVYHRARMLAAGLLGLGLQQGDRVGVMSYNSVEWLVIQMATAMADLILVNINPANLQYELKYCINKVSVSALFLDSTYHKHDYIRLLEQLIPDLTSDKPCLPATGLPSLKHVICMDLTFPGTRNILPFHSVLSSEGLGRIDDLISSIPADAATNIQFTSGTTGQPKGATLTHRNILNNGFSLGERTKHTQQDSICVAVPLYHCFGMVMGNLAALTRGMAVVYPCRGFNAQKALEACQEYQATSIYGVPTMFYEYIKQAKKVSYQLRLRTGIMAGSLCPEKLMLDVYQTLGLRDMTICYGMTETSPVSFQTSPEDTLEQKTRTVGRILPGMEAKVVDSQGNTVPINEPGQFWVRGYCVMQGYWQDPNKTKQSIQDGWMKSGDLATLDSQGYLNIVGRIKDMIIRGGENVFPKEIEDFLRSIEGVEDAQVIGVPDPRMGEEIAAVIKLSDPALTKEEIHQHCYQKMAHFKNPRYIKFVTAYPLTVTGKIQKYLLREEFAQEIQSGAASKYMVKR